MHFPYVPVVTLICFTVACNGQFKIIGLLDTKSENNNGTVESIRSFNEVVKPIPLTQNKDIDEDSDLTETINVSARSDDIKENVNFIIPYEVVTNEFKVETTSEINSVTNNKGNVLEHDKKDDERKILQDQDLIEKSIDIEIILDSEVDATNTLSTTTTSTTIGAKLYRKSFLPNIRKFSYIEGRSYHHPDSPNNLNPNSRWNNYNVIKVLQYRNKYKSKCSCERIWNCPKILSIQRCEPDYFMCCF